MKIAHIAPTSALKTDIMQAQEMHLALASQVIKDQEYARYFRNVEGFVMLDVPTREEKDFSKPYSFDKLCQAIDLINPNEVTLPDIWQASAETSIEMALEAALMLPSGTKRGPLGFLVVPRGKNWKDYKYCATEMAKIPGVTTLGIVDSYYDKMDVTREVIVHDFAIRFPDKHIHLLGVKRDLSDLQNKDIRPFVRSTDTAKLVALGLAHKSPTYGNVPDYSGRPEGFFEREITELDESYISRNIRYWNNVVSK